MSRRSIARKFGEEFNLAVWRINSQIKNPPIINHDIVRNVPAVLYPPHFMLMPVVANPPNSIPAKFF